MKVLSIAEMFGCCLFLIACQEPRKEAADCNSIRKYLIDQASEITDHALAGINSRADWEKARPARYNELVEMMGLKDLPLQGERPPLHVKVTGTVQQKGYHIEKLYYESLPGLYVPANLYVPDNITKPVPAILYVCGHAPTQKVHYQAHPRKFAQLGFVCLIIETIQFGEVRGEHWGCYARGWFNWYSRGYTPAGVELWNAIRGLDLLASRPEVDSTQLGVTGISGGGAQAWYIAAVDPRIKAAAPVCGASTVKAQVTTRTVDGHCDCMMPINTYRRGFIDIGALIAPRPLLICQADRDGLNKIESVEDMYSKIGKVYSLYGSKDKIGLVETPGGHSYHKISREAIFSFFLKNLMGKQVSPEEAGDVDENPQDQLSEDDLRVYVDGPPADDRTTTIQDSFIRLHTDPDITSESQLHAFRDSVKQFLKVKTFGAFPARELPYSSQLIFRTLDNGKYGEDVYSFASERGWRLKVDIHWAHPKDSLAPLVIVLRNADEERWASESYASEVAPGMNVAYLETRGVGEFGWAPGLQWHIRRASAWTGRTIASMQVYDVLRCLGYCRTLTGVDPNKICLAARDDMGVVALYAALMDGKCKSLILKNPPETQDQDSNPDGTGSAIEMLNCLRITDVYEIPALLTPARISFVGSIPAAYAWSGDLLTKLGKPPLEKL